MDELELRRIALESAAARANKRRGSKTVSSSDHDLKTVPSQTSQNKTKVKAPNASVSKSSSEKKGQRRRGQRSQQGMYDFCYYLKIF